MAYESTVELLIEDFQNYYLGDPMLWNQPSGCLPWWGKLVFFERGEEDEMTLELEGEVITFLLP